ncbi:MAG TPA: HAD family hydrolase [Sporichthyaceae bacterium]
MNSAVLFDIDGTLLDSNYLHALAWRRAFVECGHNVPTAWIHRHIGQGSDLLLRELLPGVDEAARAAAAAAHGRHFEVLKPELRAFDGAVELLAAVSQRGPRVVLASSASAGELPALLEALGGAEHVDVVTSSEDVTEAKPDPEIFRVAMARAGVDAGHAIAVGDTVWDIEAARRAGIGCVGVLTGGISRAELDEAGAVAVYRDTAELLAGLDSGPLRTLWT